MSETWVLNKVLNVPFSTDKAWRVSMKVSDSSGGLHSIDLIIIDMPPTMGGLSVPCLCLGAPSDVLCFINGAESSWQDFIYWEPMPYEENPYKVWIFDEPPTGELLEWLQANAVKQRENISAIQLPDGFIYNFKDAVVREGIAADPNRDLSVTEDSVGTYNYIMNLNDEYWEKQEDSLEVYSKQVPSNSLSLASIDKIGGKTIVWNQLCKPRVNGTYTNKGILFMSEDGIVTARGIADGPYASVNVPGDIEGRFRTVAGHKYLIGGVSGGSLLTYFLRCYLGTTVSFLEPAIYTETVSKEDAYFNVRIIEGVEVLDIAFSPRIHDLTAMFGAGNEPTLEEFKAMFPDDYYPYSEPTLLNAGVVSVESVGKNLLLTQSYGPISGIQCTRNSDGSVSLSGTNTRGSNQYLSPVASVQLRAGVEYTISLSGDADGYYSVYLSNYNDLGLGSNDTRLYANGEKTFVPMNTATSSVAISVQSGATISGDAYIQLEVGSTATPYSPYGTIDALPIPQAVRDLCPDYGASAGSAYNYIDWERKVYVHNVGSVDLGTLSWTLASGGYMYALLSGNASVPNDEIANMLCPLYAADTANHVVNTRTDKTMSCHQSVGRVNIYDSAYTDAVSFRTAMSGVTLYYELATPTEIDLSSVLGDNFIEVEAGGTITFENIHGNGYRIPVPNKETFEVYIG